MMFEVEYQNKTTNWEWSPAVYQPQEISSVLYDGVYFNDEFIVPDYSIVRSFFTWTNVRIKCTESLERINLWAAKHRSPDTLDANGVKLQNGDDNSTYGTYKITNNFSRDSNRFYFWIKATNKDDSYTDLSTTLADDLMFEYAVSNRSSVSVPNNEYDVLSTYNSYLSWNPRTDPLATLGNQAYVFKVDESSSKFDVARWIMGWDNTCVNILTRVRNPFNPSTQLASIGDVFGKIDGLYQYEKIWLACEKDKYIYGKVLYCLEDHDFLNHRLLVDTGIKSCGIEGFGLYYGQG